MQLLIYAPLAVLIFLTACQPKEIIENPSPADPHSFSNPDQVQITHLSLGLKTDFGNRIITGHAVYTLENKSRATKLILDTRQLIIERAEADGEPAEFTFGKEDPILGRSLTIAIHPSTKKVAVYYRTQPGSAALQWLNPNQTAGGRFPFLFTQSQAILARTWIPIQDSPGIRFTYDARVQCPPELMAVMSADNDTVIRPDGIYSFRMNQPIPSYLLALAVGHLKYHAYDNRCGIYAEPAILQKAAWEFADLPSMIDSAEHLYGPYRWGRYDVLVLPPAFPFGGMENPKITFATPTVIAGDRSLTSLIAHELAHSWSGNLVTNATWNDFWLNEGFTVYFESRIMEKIYGTEYADMLSVIGLEELKATLRQMGDTHPDTRLYLNLAGRNPDDGVTDIAYEKGRFFLTLIEQTVGRNRWDPFLKSYFEKHAFTAITTQQFESYLYQELLSETEREKINTGKWIYETGLPDNCPQVHSAELEKAALAAREFLSGKNTAGNEIQKWTTHHYLHFLRCLPDSLSASEMKRLDEQFGFNTTRNAEIRAQWLQLCITSGYSEAYSNLEDFLMTTGRRKFIRPLYQKLAKTSDGKSMAVRIYAKARPNYHAVSTHTIDEILGWNLHAEQ